MLIISLTRQPIRTDKSLEWCSIQTASYSPPLAAKRGPAAAGWVDVHPQILLLPGSPAESSSERPPPGRPYTVEKTHCLHQRETSAAPPAGRCWLRCSSIFIFHCWQLEMWLWQGFLLLLPLRRNFYILAFKKKLPHLWNTIVCMFFRTDRHSHWILGRLNIHCKF